jgi:hypothetical protein
MELHNLSEIAKDLGQLLERRFVPSTHSPHIHVVPPSTSFFCALVPLNAVGSTL